jgi:hypothetical protein
MTRPPSEAVDQIRLISHLQEHLSREVAFPVVLDICGERHFRLKHVANPVEDGGENVAHAGESTTLKIPPAMRPSRFPQNRAAMDLQTQRKIGFATPFQFLELKDAVVRVENEVKLDNFSCLVVNGRTRCDVGQGPSFTPGSPINTFELVFIAETQVDDDAPVDDRLAYHAERRRRGGKKKEAASQVASDFLISALVNAWLANDAPFS